MRQYFCVGTYSEPIRFGTGELFCGKGEGLYLCALEGTDIRIVSVLPLCNPSYLAFNEVQRRIYTVNEARTFLGHAGGGVSEIAYDSAGTTRLLRQLPTGGEDPCHVSFSADHRMLVVSNYSGGSVSVWPLDSDGGIVNQRQLFVHTGSGIHPRQAAPHAHTSLFMRHARAFVTMDLGKDALIWYAVSGAGAVPVAEKSCQCLPGSGPRTGELSIDGKNLYVVNELNSTLTRFTVAEGGLTRAETTPILPDGMPVGEGSNGGADLHLAPDGRTLYASHRGTSSISTFRIAQATGALTLLSNVPCGGLTPRNFALDPSGKLLLCGNQDSDHISIFRLESDGTPVMLAQRAFPTPVCIRFFQNADFA